MIIVDLPHQYKPQRVAAIGSCRIGVPINLIHAAGATRWVLTDLGLAYTTAGARQLLELLRSGDAPPPFFASLIYPPGAMGPPTNVPADVVETIDTFLVEVCVPRILRVGRWALQENLFEVVLSEHAEILLPWWQEACRRGGPSQPMIDQVLDAFRRSGRAISPELELMVRTLEITTQNEDSLARAVAELKRDFPGRWIFISHFALPEVDSMLMNQRRQLAHMLRNAAEAAGAEFFDPSELVAAAGREHALAANGADLYHYSSDFERVIADSYLTLLRRDG